MLDLKRVEMYMLSFAVFPNVNSVFADSTKIDDFAIFSITSVTSKSDKANVTTTRGYDL